MRREHYDPGTEPLAPDAMRVIAPGTGRPFPRRAQANTSFLVELGKGDIFLIDFGWAAGRTSRRWRSPVRRSRPSSSPICTPTMSGTFPTVLWAAGRGRLKPLEIRGPAGGDPRFGLKHLVETQGSSRARDRMTRSGLLPAAGTLAKAHAFDHAAPATVHERYGVVMRAFPAAPIADGPISRRRAWNGLTFVFAGDTTPSRFMVEHGQAADLLIHACCNTTTERMLRSGYDIRTAIGIGSIAHTSPEDASKVLGLVKLRLTVLYHHRDDFDKAREILDRMAVEPETVRPNRAKRDAV